MRGRTGVPLPLQVLPSGFSVNPFLHLQLYEAGLLTQMCWHWWSTTSHISEPIAHTHRWANKRVKMSRDIEIKAEIIDHHHTVWTGTLPCLRCNLLHRILSPPVSHYHGNSWDVQVCWSRSIFLCEGCFHGVLDGQTCHCPCGKVLHLFHRLLHLSPGGVGVEWEFRLYHAAILKQTHPGGIWANFQKLEQVDDEGLDLFIVMGADASGAVDDKDEIQRDGFVRDLWDLVLLTFNSPAALFEQKSALDFKSSVKFESLTGHLPTGLVETVVTFSSLAAAGLTWCLSSREASEHIRQKKQRASSLVLMTSDDWSI